MAAIAIDALLWRRAEPVKLTIPGADSPQVCYLRSLSDCPAIIGNRQARRVVLVGASFIAMEVAASLILRKLQVHVVAPEGCRWREFSDRRWGEHLRRLHERNRRDIHLSRASPH